MSATAQRKWRNKDLKWAWAVSTASRAKVRAAEKGLPYDLTSKYVYSIMEDNCPVFGTPFVFLGNGHSPEGPALDRLYPERGYVRGNVTVISMKANAIKNAFASHDVWKVALWLAHLDQ